MYNLFFFCKGTKLERTLWLQTVFHTKGRRQNGKSAHKISVSASYFPPVIIFLRRYNRGLPLFCRKKNFRDSGPFEVTLKLGNEKFQMIIRKRSTSPTAPTVFRSILPTSWGFGFYHTDLHGGRQTWCCQQTALSHLAHFDLAVGVHCFCLWSGFVKLTYQTRCQDLTAIMIHSTKHS